MIVEDIEEFRNNKSIEEDSYKFIKFKKGKYDLSYLNNIEIKNSVIVFGSGCKLVNKGGEKLNINLHNSIIKNIDLSCFEKTVLKCKNSYICDSVLKDIHIYSSDKLYLFDNYISKIKIFDSNDINLNNINLYKKRNIHLEISVSTDCSIENVTMDKSKPDDFYTIKCYSSSLDIRDIEFVGSNNHPLVISNSEILIDNCVFKDDTEKKISIDNSKIAFNNNNIEQKFKDKLSSDSMKNEVENAKARQIFTIDKI